MNNYELRITNYEMKEDNLIQQKSFAFALRIVRLFRFYRRNERVCTCKTSNAFGNIYRCKY